MEAACLIAAAQGYNLCMVPEGIAEAVRSLQGRGLLDEDCKLTHFGRLCATTITTVAQREIARFSGCGPQT